ncbi:MAG TPA: lytic transglycosylase domain-containing protein [Bryobacteraceae bacterium]|nr:lytic transglycosylase domain-containing protein [Bryobacteraceae bacterium]
MAAITCSAGVTTVTEAPDSTAPRVRSVVRVDSRSHKLVRVFQIMRPIGEPAPRISDPAVRTLVDETAKSYNVSPALVRSVISVESGFNAWAVSPKGAMGMMQLMPGTARRFGVSNAFDVKQNIDGGVRYLRFLQDLFGNDALAIAAYNAGERAVEKYNGIPPYPETMAYVKKVGARYERARKQAAAKSVPPPATETQPAAGDKHPPLEMYYDEQGRVHIETR